MSYVTKTSYFIVKNTSSFADKVGYIISGFLINSKQPADIVKLKIFKVNVFTQ